MVGREQDVINIIEVGGEETLKTQVKDTGPQDLCSTN